MQPLTDEEREDLCYNLRNYYDAHEGAEEIEWLAKEVAFWKARWKDTGDEARQRIAQLTEENKRLKEFQAKQEMEIVMAIGGRQHPSVR